MSAPPITMEMARQLGFTLEDLAANRFGQITAAQRQAMLRGGLSYLAFGLLFLAVCVIVLVIAWRNNLNVFVKWMPFPAGGVVVFLGLHAAYGALADYWQPEVRYRDGPARFGLINHHAGALALGENSYQYFDFGGHPERVLTAGAYYRVYYSAKGMRGLSIEPVPATAK